MKELLKVVLKKMCCQINTSSIIFISYWIVNSFLDNFYKDTFLYSIGVK